MDIAMGSRSPSMDYSQPASINTGCVCTWKKAFSHSFVPPMFSVSCCHKFRAQHLPCNPSRKE